MSEESKIEQTGKEKYGDVHSWMLDNMMRQFAEALLEWIDYPERNVHRFHTGDFMTNNKIEVELKFKRSKIKNEGKEE